MGIQQIDAAELQSVCHLVEEKVIIQSGWKSILGYKIGIMKKNLKNTPTPNKHRKNTLIKKKSLEQNIKILMLQIAD